jgi:hypothetical protein
VEAAGIAPDSATLHASSLVVVVEHREGFTESVKSSQGLDWEKWEKATHGQEMARLLRKQREQRETKALEIEMRSWFRNKDRHSRFSFHVLRSWKILSSLLSPLME